jgi:hypothetical protein
MALAILAEERFFLKFLWSVLKNYLPRETCRENLRNIATVARCLRNIV